MTNLTAGDLTLYLAGLKHLAAGRAMEAVESIAQVARENPGHPGARRNLIRARLSAGQHAVVLAATTAALTEAPDDAELHFLQGTALNAQARPAEARDALTRAIALNPTFAPAWLNRGNANADLDAMADAERDCRAALARDPGLTEARASLGFVLTAMGRLPEAIAVLEQAQDDTQAHWNLATAALLAGDLPRGFAEYEWRKRHDRFRRDFIDLAGPVWDGSGPSGRTILIHAEQGLGDTIQFARYLPLIAARGCMPILACEPGLVPLFAAMPGVVAVSKFAPLPAYDAWIDQMSLPRVFGTTIETIPSPDRYLTANASGSGPEIGLAWKGNPLHGNDRRRTPPPEAFQPLLDDRFVSLIPDRTLPGLALPDRRLRTFADTAAVIAGLDLVIAVDTAAAHLAAALGKPTWILLPHAPDWRWMLDRTDSPWYRSARLFRQPTPGDWRSVMAAVRDALISG